MDLINRTDDLNDYIVYPTGKSYPTYNHYLVDTKALTTDLGMSQKFENVNITLSSPDYQEEFVQEDTESTQPAASTIEENQAEILEGEEQSSEQSEVPKPKKEISKSTADRISKAKKNSKVNRQQKPREVSKRNGIQTMTDQELSWFNDIIGANYLTVVKGVDKVLTSGGVEAWGYYHQGMVTLAESGEAGTA